MIKLHYTASVFSHTTIVDAQADHSQETNYNQVEIFLKNVL